MGERPEQVEGQPAGYLRFLPVFPETIRPLQLLHESNEVSNPFVICAGANPSAQVEQQGKVESGEEGHEAPRLLGTDEPGDIETESPFLSGFPTEKQVERLARFRC